MLLSCSQYQFMCLITQFRRMNRPRSVLESAYDSTEAPKLKSVAAAQAGEAFGSRLAFLAAGGENQEAGRS